MITRRSALAALATFALAPSGLALAQDTPSLAEPASTPGAPDILAPSYDLGWLPLETEAPVEHDCGDHLVIATPFYALTLPKALLGEGFSWSYDARRDLYRAPDFVATGFLSVDPGVGAAIEPFDVFVRTPLSWDVAYPQDPSLGHLESAGIAAPFAGLNVFVATKTGDALGLAKYVSPGAWAFALPEEGGTRVYAPDFSVLVPEGALPQGWSFLYTHARKANDGADRGRRLRLFACDEDRELNRYVVEFEYCDEWNDAGDHSCAGEQGCTVGDPRSLVHVVGPYVQVDATTWEPSRKVAEAWAPQVSLEITRSACAAAFAPADSGVWRVATPWYSFEVPESWRGKVCVEVEGEAARIWPKDEPDSPVAAVEVNHGVTKVGVKQTGDILLELDSGMGHNVILWNPSLGVEGAFDASELLATLKVAMPEPWEKVYAMLPLADSGDRLLVDFHADAVAALGGWGSYDWLLELAQDPRVVRWNADAAPVVRFLEWSLAPVVRVQDVRDLAYTTSGGQEEVGLGAIEWTLSFEVGNLAAATVQDVVRTQWAPSQVSTSLSPYFCGLTPEALADPAEARRVLDAAADAAVRVYDSPGVTYTLAWTYTMPNGTQLNGEVSV